MKELIVAPSIGQTPAAPGINEEGKRLKQELLVKASAIIEVSSPETATLAAKTAAGIKDHLTDVEKNRKEFKDPFYQMGKLIDATAKDHIEDLETELRRINQALGAFEEERRRRAEEQRVAAAKAAAELEEKQRKQREAAELEEKRAQEEKEAAAAKARAAQEASEASKKVPTAEEKANALQAELEAEEKAEEAAEKSRELEAKLVAERKQLQEQQFAAAEAARKSKTAGIALRQEIIVTVTNPHLLYEARRDCVKLVPDIVQIKYLINHHPEMELPGVTWTKQAVSSTRR